MAKPTLGQRANIADDSQHTALLLAGKHRDPHRFLGAHPIADSTGRKGVVVRAMHPDAVASKCALADQTFAMTPCAQRSLPTVTTRSWRIPMTGVFVRLMMFVRIGLILRFARLERKNVTV
jgi:hypothetical protein